MAGTPGSAARMRRAGSPGGEATRGAGLGGRLRGAGGAEGDEVHGGPRRRAPLRPPGGRRSAAAGPRAEEACVPRCESRWHVLRARAAGSLRLQTVAHAALRPTRTCHGLGRRRRRRECEPQVDSIRKGWQVLARQHLCTCAFWNLGCKRLEDRDSCCALIVQT